MGKIDNAEKFAQMWRKSRLDAGVSQEYVAKLLGVSKKTVQNWETGYSCPSQLMGFQWFTALGLPPLPYYLELLYGDFENISPAVSDEQIDKALTSLVGGLNNDMKRKLLFVLNADHGSSVAGLLELFTAYLHIPLEYRLSIAQSILIDFNIAEAYGATANHIKPNTELLEKSIKYAIKSVAEKKKTYMLGEDLGK